MFNLGTTKGFLSATKEVIFNEGATHLDAYASKNQPLQEIYEKTLGFHVASSMDYNMDYDHDNIAKNHDKPEIVFMVNNAVTDAKHFSKDEYDEAQKYAQERINTINSFYNSKLNTIFASVDKAIATNSWSEEALKQLDNLINNLENGRILFERFPQAALRGFHEGGRINEAASLLLRGSKSPDSKNTRSFTERYERDKREQPIQERIIESCAKTNDSLDYIYEQGNKANKPEDLIST